MIDVVVVRDPDYSNAIAVYGDDEAVIIDVDLGAMDLANAEEFKDWAESLLAEAQKCRWNDARKNVLNVVLDVATTHGHDMPTIPAKED